MKGNEETFLKAWPLELTPEVTRVRSVRRGGPAERRATPVPFNGTEAWADRTHRRALRKPCGRPARMARRRSITGLAVAARRRRGVVAGRGTSSTRPTQTFVRSLIVGLYNGALYALIALGYTLVYGIIELINFAHGDLFMLGTVFAADLHRRVARAGRLEPRRAGWLFAGRAARRRWRSARSINVAVERLAYRRLRNAPKLAPLITAVGVSFIFQNIGILLERLGAEVSWPLGAAAAAASRSGRSSIRVDVPSSSSRVTDPAAAAADLDRAEDPAGQGDARDGAGPGRRRG